MQEVLRNLWCEAVFVPGTVQCVSNLTLPPGLCCTYTHDVHTHTIYRSLPSSFSQRHLHFLFLSRFLQSLMFLFSFCLPLQFFFSSFLLFIILIVLLNSLLVILFYAFLYYHIEAFPTLTCFIHIFISVFFYFFIYSTFVCVGLPVITLVIISTYTKRKRRDQRCNYYTVTHEQAVADS